MSNCEDDRGRAANHEAAHALSAAVLGFRVLGCGLWRTDDARRPWDGQTGFDTGRAEVEKAPDLIDDELAVGWAGRAVELLLYGAVSLPLMLDPDYHIMRDVARRIHLPGDSDARVRRYVDSVETDGIRLVRSHLPLIEELGSELLVAPAAVIGDNQVDHNLDGLALAGRLSDLLGYPVAGSVVA